MSEPNGGQKLAIRGVVCYLKECTPNLDEDETVTTYTVREYTKRLMATVTKGNPAMEQRVGSERVERSATDNNRIGATTAEDAPTDTF